MASKTLPPNYDDVMAVGHTLGYTCMFDFVPQIEEMEIIKRAPGETDKTASLRLADLKKHVLGTSLGEFSTATQLTSAAWPRPTQEELDRYLRGLEGRGYDVSSSSRSTSHYWKKTTPYRDGGQGDEKP